MPRADHTAASPNAIPGDHRVADDADDRHRVGAAGVPSKL